MFLCGKCWLNQTLSVADVTPFFRVNFHTAHTDNLTMSTEQKTDL